MVCYCWPGLVKVTVVRSLASQLLNTDTLSGMILVVQDRITPQAMKALQGLKFKVEVFQVWFLSPCFPFMFSDFLHMLHCDIIEI